MTTIVPNRIAQLDPSGQSRQSGQSGQSGQSVAPRRARRAGPQRERRAPRPAGVRLQSAGFDVAIHEGRGRAARVVPGMERVCVVVADPGAQSAGLPVGSDLAMTLGGSACLVWGRADGSVQVRATWAPPALLVSAERTVMVPQTPGIPGLSVMAPGDRLLVLSVSAYEAAPERMVRLLHEEPARLLAADADDLLRTLFRDVPDAGGAILTRR